MQKPDKGTWLSDSRKSTKASMAGAQAARGKVEGVAGQAATVRLVQAEHHGMSFGFCSKFHWRLRMVARGK